MIIEIPNDNSIVKWKNDDKDEWKYAEISDLIKAYENVPTGEYEILTKEAYSDLCLRASKERPQGEWIDIDSLVSKAMCSNCKNIIITEPFGKPNYCPNCGADMRGKPNQLRDCENCIHHSDNGCEVWKCEFEKRSDL